MSEDKMEDVKEVEQFLDFLTPLIKSKSPEVKCQRALCGYKIIYKATEELWAGKTIFHPS